MPVACVYSQPPALFTPAVVLTALDGVTGSFGTLPSAKIVPSSVGNAAAPRSAFRAYWIAIAERIEPSCPRIVATRACSRMSSYLGMATAARIPRITMTITSSISVNPDSDFLPCRSITSNLQENFYSRPRPRGPLYRPGLLDSKQIGFGRAFLECKIRRRLVAERVHQVPEGEEDGERGEEDRHAEHEEKDRLDRGGEILDRVIDVLIVISGHPEEHLVDRSGLLPYREHAGDQRGEDRASPEQLRQPLAGHQPLLHPVDLLFHGAVVEGAPRDLEALDDRDPARDERGEHPCETRDDRLEEDRAEDRHRQNEAVDAARRVLGPVPEDPGHDQAPDHGEVGVPV